MPVTPPFPPPMADMHSHILPGVDDGADTLDKALAMLWEAVKDGVMYQVLTPHVHRQRYENTRSSLEQRFIEFQEIVEEALIPIELHMAAEVRIGHEVMQMVDEDEIPWLGQRNGEKTFLLEFPQNAIPVGSENLILWLRKQGVLPIIVHPERNLAFQKFPEKLQPLVSMGCPLQITAGSLLGKFGPGARKLAYRLIEEDQVSVIASDCHNQRYRPPNLSQGVKAAAKLVGKARAAEMVTDNVFELIMGNQPQRSALNLGDS